MNNSQTISIKDYLFRKSIEFLERNGELITRCIFSSCDADSIGNEAHLYFNIETGQYDCKKCGAQGNIITLAKHFGDDMSEIMLEYQDNGKTKLRSRSKFDPALVEQCHQAIPERIRKYLNARGIPDAIISQYKLGYGTFYGKNWITIPIQDENGQYVFFKLRQDPDDGNEKILFPKGTSAQIYDWQMLKTARDRVVLCEGELDRLALVAKGVPAVTSTAGAMTFKKEWRMKFTYCNQVYVCYDNDEPGRAGAQRVFTLLSGIGTKLHLITLPKEVGEQGDITDYFTKLNGSVDDLFVKYSNEVVVAPEQQRRVVEIEKPDHDVSFEEWRDIIKTNFPELVFAAEMCLAVVVQILIKDITNPFALVLVDAPSSGKTITLNFFAEIDKLAYPCDKFTPASFVSNATNVKREDLPKIDLLPRIRYKTFVLRDLATLFSKREDDLNELLGTLTRVLDGEGFNPDTGAHGQRHYMGEYLFMMLAASTPIPPRVWKIMGNLGSRLFFLTLNTTEKTEETLVRQIKDKAYKQKEKTCRDKTKQLLQTLWNRYPDGVEWDRMSDQDSDLTIIARCAKLLSKLRGVINVWKDRSIDGEGYDYTRPVIERPDRLNQWFYNHARGYALMQGKTQIDSSDLKGIIELTIDSMPSTRAKLFRSLLEHNGSMSTTQVEEALTVSKPTARKEMQALSILEVCDDTEDQYSQEIVLKLRPEFRWFLSDECKRLRGIPIAQSEDIVSDLLNHIDKANLTPSALPVELPW